jgi:hypothetical protein
MINRKRSSASLWEWGLCLALPHKALIPVMSFHLGFYPLHVHRQLNRKNTQTNLLVRANDSSLLLAIRSWRWSLIPETNLFIYLFLFLFYFIFEDFYCVGDFWEFIIWSSLDNSKDNSYCVVIPRHFWRWFQRQLLHFQA